MTIRTFNANDWATKIAIKWGGLDTWEGETDICSWSRAVGKALFGLSSALIVTMVVLYGIADTLAWLAVGMLHSWIEPSIPVMMVLGITSVATLFVGVSAIDVYRTKSEQEKYWAAIETTGKPPEPSIVVSAWRAFHDKTCFKIKIVGGSTTNTQD